MNVNFLKYYQIDYIVKEKEGIVIAKIHDSFHCPSSLDILLGKHYCNLAWNIGSSLLDAKHIAKMRGIAKCSPEDTFNIEIGKKIAYLRLRKKFNHYIIQVLTNVHDFYLNYVVELEGAIDKLKYFYEKDDERIGKEYTVLNFL